MPTAPFLPATKMRKGLTLTESAIFVGIAGLVLGAIWAASNSVSDNKSMNNTIGATLQIVQNVRSLYAMESTFSGNAGWSTGSDITQTMIRSEVVPSLLINPSNPVTLLSTWNSPIRIKVGSALDRFDIEFANTLPNEVCIGLTALAIGAGRDKGLVEVNAGGTSFTGNALANLTVAAIPACTRVTFSFRLKG